MIQKSAKFDLVAIANGLTEIIQNSLTSRNITIPKAPTLAERQIIEYDSRMRVLGLEKFNGACFVTSVSFYLSKNHLTNHDAVGVIVLFFEEEMISKLLKALGHRDVNDDHHEMVLDRLGEYTMSIAIKFKDELRAAGYPELVLSEVAAKGRNDIVDGVEFPYSQYNYQEITIELWKKKAILVNLALAPL